MAKVLKPVGVIASGSKSFYAPVLVYKDAERVLREESLAVIRDRVTGKQYLGLIRWLSKIDPLLPATQRSGVVDNPRLAEIATNVPFETSYVRIIGEICGGKLEPTVDPPTPRSEVLLIESPEDLALDVGEGMTIGEHKYSGVKVPLNPKYLPYHIGVVGATGTGKSRLVKALIDEVLSKTDWKVIVFDHSGVDYTSYYPHNVVDASQVMPDPATLSELIAEGSMLEDQEEYIMAAVYAYIAYFKRASATTVTHGPRRTDKTLSPSRTSFDCSISYVEGLDLTDIEKIMTEITWDIHTFRKCVEIAGKEVKARDSTVAKMSLLIGTYSKGLIESLNKKKLTAREVVNRVLKERMVVVDLSSVEVVVRRYIVKSVIDELWRIVDERREKPRTLVVIDEAHNYACMGCGASLRSIERTAREGRKWEIGLVLASQRIIDFSTDIRNNINTFYFSRLQTPGDFENLRGVLDLGGLGPESLSVLGVREFFFAGLGNPLRFPILMRVKEVGEPTVG
ncbi:MAG: ATP-binding protein [Sulfolobales archaeon]